MGGGPTPALAPYSRLVYLYADSNHATNANADLMAMVMLIVLTEKPKAFPLLHAEAQAPHGALGALVGRGYGRRVHLGGENSRQDTTATSEKSRRKEGAARGGWRTSPLSCCRSVDNSEREDWNECSEEKAAVPINAS